MKKSRFIYVVGICIALVVLISAGLIVYTLMGGSRITDDDKKEVKEKLETVLRTAYIEKDYEKADTLFYPVLNEEDLLWEVTDLDDKIFEDNKENNEITDIEVEIKEAKEFKEIEKHEFDHEKDAILNMQKVCDDDKFYVYSGNIHIKGTKEDFTVEMTYDYPPFLLGKVNGKWECINYHALVDMYYNDLTLEDMNEEELWNEIYQFSAECLTDYEVNYGDFLGNDESFIFEWNSNGLVLTENEKFNEILLSAGANEFIIVNKTGKCPRVELYRNKDGIYDIRVNFQ